MLKKTLNIVTGYYNLLLGNIQIKLLKAQRTKICKNCPIYDKGFCSKAKGGCGCYIPAKASCKKCKCPTGLW